MHIIELTVMTKRGTSLIPGKDSAWRSDELFALLAKSVRHANIYISTAGVGSGALRIVFVGVTIEVIASDICRGVCPG